MCQHVHWEGEAGQRGRARGGSVSPHACTGGWEASHPFPNPNVGRSGCQWRGWGDAGGSSCPGPWRQRALLPAELAAPTSSPAGASFWEGLASYLCFPLPVLPSLASPRSGTDVPLSRNSSYLVNQSLAGVPDKAIWFSASL